MELLEAVSVLPGWNHRLFYTTAYDCVGDRRAFLCFGVFHDRVHNCQKTDFRRPGLWMAIAGMYYALFKWHTILLHRNSRTVSCEDLHGSKAQTHLSFEGKALKKQL